MVSTTNMDRFLYDFVSIVREVVIEKGYLATQEQILNEDIATWSIMFDFEMQTFRELNYTSFFDGTCIIDTEEHAKEIAEMFNNDANVQAKLKELGLK